MVIRKDVNELFIQAVQKDQIFDYLTGQNGYEIRLNEAYMPTDIISATFKIDEYLKNNPNFDKKKIIDAFFKMSSDSEWSWLIVYYSAYFERRNMQFLPLNELYENVKSNKVQLCKNNNWICFNFAPRYNNLWDVIVFENNRFINDGYRLPKLE